MHAKKRPLKNIERRKPPHLKKKKKTQEKRLRRVLAQEGALHQRLTEPLPRVKQVRTLYGDKGRMFLIRRRAIEDQKGKLVINSKQEEKLCSVKRKRNHPKGSETEARAGGIQPGGNLPSGNPSPSREHHWGGGGARL